MPLLVLRQLSPAFIVRTHLVGNLCAGLCVVAVQFVYLLYSSSSSACHFSLLACLLLVYDISLRVRSQCDAYCSYWRLFLLFCLCTACALCATFEFVRLRSLFTLVCVCSQRAIDITHIYSSTWYEFPRVAWPLLYYLLYDYFSRLVFFVFSSECVHLSPLSAFVRARSQCAIVLLLNSNFFECIHMHKYFN